VNSLNSLYPAKRLQYIEESIYVPTLLRGNAYIRLGGLAEGFDMVCIPTRSMGTIIQIASSLSNPFTGRCWGAERSSALDKLQLWCVRLKLPLSSTPKQFFLYLTNIGKE
ncbi:MAG: hypothetical protein JAZ17_00490, partial [Candidatus Thiodiazotropha endolucinida]|nr:hypothetical protein [Candidatus Thiodiazotropha taylori]MCG8092104.1 hypothetical protein [Candidatus Thiodiazotropha endolucinida]MCW4344813.1 hypothetical protein [Candidatus Thiodiazotropha endolucinida]